MCTRVLNFADVLWIKYRCGACWSRWAGGPPLKPPQDHDDIAYHAAGSSTSRLANSAPTWTCRSSPPSFGSALEATSWATSGLARCRCTINCRCLDFAGSSGKIVGCTFDQGSAVSRAEACHPDGAKCRSGIWPCNHQKSKNVSSCILVEALTYSAPSVSRPGPKPEPQPQPSPGAHLPNSTSPNYRILNP